MAEATVSKAKTKPKKIKGRKRWWWAAGGFFMLIIIAGFMPRQGSLNFGLCKAFIELNETYPQSIEYVAADDMGEVQRISYNRVDPFGQRTFNTIVCRFKTTEDGRLVLDKININGDRAYPQEDPANVARFNRGISALIANPPDLALPSGLPADIKDYR